MNYKLGDTIKLIPKEEMTALFGYKVPRIEGLPVPDSCLAYEKENNKLIEKLGEATVIINSFHCGMLLVKHESYDKELFQIPPECISEVY